MEPVALQKAPVILTSKDDSINTGTLRQVASALGDEWNVLASHLRVEKTRIQAILRNNQANNRGDEDLRFEMLMTWAKKVPKSVNKVWPL